MIFGFMIMLSGWLIGIIKVMTTIQPFTLIGVRDLMMSCPSIWSLTMFALVIAQIEGIRS